MRGAGVSRGCDYGALPDMTRTADSFTTVICMIEDRQALDVIDDISKVEGVDAMFLGRGDLGLSLSNAVDPVPALADAVERSEEHTSELQSLMRISYAVFCLKKKTN